MKVYFMNNGDFDIRAMLTMGVSAKDKEDAVGFFGTGFKYAIAIILRNGGTVKVSTISGVYEFTAKKENIRGKEFDVVYCNDQNAGFTTHLGTNWKPWMAFRELYCNAKDEGGVIETKIDLNYDTIIEVDCSAIHQAYLERDWYFLNSNPVHVHSGCEIHEGNHPFTYYKGIAVAEKKMGEMFTYNILSPITLTEDRTVRNGLEVLFAKQKALQSCKDTALLRKVLESGDHYEAHMTFDTDWATSDEFLLVCRELEKTQKGLSESAREHYKKIMHDAGNFPEFSVNRVQQKMLDKAIEFLEGININPRDFPIKTVTGLGNGIMGRALDGTIYLSEIPFNMGTKQVASTLMEEWVHLSTGAKDFDRVMQSWLFDKILSIGEELKGEPL